VKSAFSTRARQTIYYPYLFASVHGRGEAPPRAAGLGHDRGDHVNELRDALALSVTSPGYDAEVADDVPYLDIAGVYDEEPGTLTFFAVNRHAWDALDVEVALQGFAAARVIDHQVMTSADLEAVNTLKEPLAIAPRKGSGTEAGDSCLAVRLPPHSYQMIRLAVAKT
jgi:alpha-N-arabinofuranosidase